MATEAPNGSELAAAMHAEAVDLWNHFWEAGGRRYNFPERDAIERVQRALSQLAWPLQGPIA